MKKIYIFILFLFFLSHYDFLFSQEVKKNISGMTKDELSQLSYQDLMNLSLEDLMTVANKFGLSSDEILEYFLNKDVTSASKRAEKSLNSPLSTTVLSRDEILNSGATNIPEALRLVPGIIVREKTNGNYDVHIRGNDNLPPKGMSIYSENSISLVMIDGRPVYSFAFGGIFWETLPVDLNDIDRIEVIRGPSSALYGPNAVSGAINIITRTVDSKKIKADGNLQLGTNNSKLANAGVSFGIGEKLKARLSGNYARHNRFEKDYYAFDYDQRYTAGQIRTMTLLSTGMPVEPFFDKIFKDQDLSLEKYAGNAFIHYDVSKKITIDISTGTQESGIISSTLVDNGLSLGGRTSTTHYGDLRLKAYGFSIQANYLGGNQDIQKGYLGFKAQAKVQNTSLEYEYVHGSLILRPGISYQSSVSNDDKWVDATLKNGFLNGSRELNSLAYYLRADYKAFEKLRLVAAVRGDKYNLPDETKLTYQLISTYSINENNLIRGGYSRANRGAFLAESYANMDWEIIPDFYYIHLQKNEKLTLPTINMLEVGYRTRIGKNILVELEAFHTIFNQLTAYMPDAMTLDFDFLPLKTGQAPSTLPSRMVGRGQFQNIELKSVQNGLTANISVVANKNLYFKFFGTVQKTTLKNYYDRTMNDDYFSLQNAAGAKYMFDVFRIMKGDSSLLPQPGNVKNYDVTYTSFRDSSNKTITNKATPAFFGGFSVDYSFNKKLHCNSSLYFFTEQKLLHSKINDIGRYRAEYVANPETYNPGMFSDAYTVKPKAILNLKLSYKFWKENNIFVNARNLLNSKSKEFAFMDEVRGLYMAGINFNF